MMTDLLNEIDKFLAASGMSPTYFGKKAANNSLLVERLRNGRPIQVPTADKVRAFMLDNKPQASAGERERATGT